MKNFQFNWATKLLVSTITSCSLLLSGCADSEPMSTTDPIITTTTLTPGEVRQQTRVAQEICARQLSNAQVDHRLQNLSFSRGEIAVSIERKGQVSQCYNFTKWGNLNPFTPPDSLLFLFRAPGSDGMQIDLPISEIANRTAFAGKAFLVAEGKYYAAELCNFVITVFSAEGAEGRFNCPTAIKMPGNPFAPDDDLNPHAEELTPPSSATPAPAPVETVGFNGWFSASP